MRTITDFHIHSKYSRACSKELTLENIAFWCEKKGIDIVVTGDWTHPVWFKEIETKLQEVAQGLYALKNNSSKTRFILGTEVSQIYKKNGITRRVHNLVLAPSVDVVRKINTWLANNDFNVAYDGRPILGIDSEELYRAWREIDERVVFMPAHAWTPWYAVFGSKSGFDSLEECFGEMTPYVYAIETGLSSDPPMNHRVSGLDNVMLISNSDAHSLPKLGREANVFDLDNPTYDEIIRILKEKDKSKFLYTIEFYAQEGKYFLDGCANCKFSCEPEETKRLGGRCPSCKKLMTVGVLNRVVSVGDRAKDALPANRVPHKYIVPLLEVIAECYNVKSISSKKVRAEYEGLLEKLGNEFHILLDSSIADVAAAAQHPLVATAIERMRAGNMQIVPGYDGVFGVVKIFNENERSTFGQGKLV